MKWLIQYRKYKCTQLLKSGFCNLPVFCTGILLLFFSSCYKEQAVPVKADFSIQVVNNDYSVPVKIKIINNTTGAESYNWTLQGSDQSSSTSKTPGTLLYEKEGNYKIILEATNPYGGKDKKEIEIKLDAAMSVGFSIANTKSWFPDVSVQINNTSQGATSYNWLFEGGVPASSTQKDPGNVVFSTPGTYKISLSISNGKETQKMDTTITVLPQLLSDFDITWLAEDNDMQVPFTAMLQNKSVSATSYNWSFVGANIATSTAASPVVTYTNAGTYTISLVAANDKKTATISKTITLLPNENLYKFIDVKLGINTAHNTVGYCFSSSLGKTVKSSEINPTNGSKIDFAFFGLNSLFGYNKIISPDEVQYYTFNPIPNAIHTNIINKQESCSCSTSMSAIQFDAMVDDSFLRSLVITPTSGGLSDFDNNLQPRVIIFQTNDGRKGAIKIKQYVNDGNNSYIVCDVKMMKAK